MSDKSEYSEFRWNLNQSNWWHTPQAARLRIEGLYLTRLPFGGCAGNATGLPIATARIR